MYDDNNVLKSFKFWFLKNNYNYIDTDISFWKNREKQFQEFYEQIDQQIGDYLFLTKSACMDIYRQTIETATAGKNDRRYFIE